MHLNKLEEEFGDKGFSVIAVTDESAEKTEPWIEKYEANYAYAYDKGGELAKWAGVRGIPHAVLVNGKGEVVWKGHPGGLSAGKIKKNLKGIKAKALWEWPKSAKAVKSAFEKGNLSGALEKAKGLKDEGERKEFTEFVQAEIASSVAKLNKLSGEGDYRAALALGKDLEKGLKGLPEQEAAANIVESITSDKAKQKVIKGQAAFDKLKEARDKVHSRGKAEKLIVELREISGKYPGTIISRKAEAMIQGLMNVR